MALAFVDDSGGGGDSPYLVLAGYTASNASWAAFVPRWQRTLDLAPKLTYFKMAEAENLKGQFAGWNVSERDARLRLFTDVILECDLWERQLLSR